MTILHSLLVFNKLRMIRAGIIVPMATFDRFVLPMYRFTPASLDVLMMMGVSGAAGNQQEVSRIVMCQRDR